MTGGSVNLPGACTTAYWVQVLHGRSGDGGARGQHRGRRHPFARGGLQRAARATYTRPSACARCGTAVPSVLLERRARDPAGAGTTVLRTIRQPEPGELWRFTERRLQTRRAGRRAGVGRRALRRGDLEMAHRDRAPAIVQAIEGCQFLEGAGSASARCTGARRAAAPADGALLPERHGGQPDRGGLTAFGRDAISDDRLGIVIDVAHTPSGAAAKASMTPLILSHTAAAQDSPGRSPSHLAEHAKLIASTGGVVGGVGEPPLPAGRLCRRHRPRRRRGGRGSRGGSAPTIPASAPSPP